MVAAKLCPDCNGKLLPVRYGFPGPEMMEQARRGEIVLGGCIVSDDDPAWGCSECGARFHGPPLRPAALPE